MKIIDNILPTHYQNSIEKVLNDSIQWNYSPFTSRPILPLDLFEKFNLQEQFQLIYPVYSEDSSYHNTDFSHLFLLPLMEFFQQEYNSVFNLKQVNRLKINLKTKRSCNSNSNHYNFPHVDMSSENKGLTAIYYVNDSDGDTFFFKNKTSPYYDITNINEETRFLEGLEIVKRVSPKKGRMIIFNSSTVHAGSHPIKSDRRIAINYNIRL